MDSCSRRDAGTGYNVQFRFCRGSPTESPYENTQLRIRVLDSCSRRDAGTGYNVQFRFCRGSPMESPYENTQLRIRVLDSCSRRDAGTGYNVQFRFCRGSPMESPYENTQLRLNKKPRAINSRAFINPGTGLSFQAVTHQVLSLLTVFTFVFGMGTGVFRSHGHQEPFRVLMKSPMYGS